MPEVELLIYHDDERIVAGANDFREEPEFGNDD